MSLGSIIRDRREQLGVTQELVAAQVRISKPYLSNIETGKAKNPPSDKVLRAMEKALNFAPGELVAIAHRQKTPSDVREQCERLEAEVNKLLGVIHAVQQGNLEAAAELDVGHAGGGQVPEGTITSGRLVPVINSVTAGYPHYFTDLDYPPGTADEYIRCPDVHDPQAFAAVVVGDSMEPDYQQGDMVIFSPQLEVRNGDDCFIRFEEGVGTTFKRVYVDDEETIRLQPLNRTYPAQIYPREKVTGLWPALFRVQRIRRR